MAEDRGRQGGPTDEPRSGSRAGGLMDKLRGHGSSGSHGRQEGASGGSTAPGGGGDRLEVHHPDGRVEHPDHMQGNHGGVHYNEEHRDQYGPHGGDQHGGDQHGGGQHGTAATTSMPPVGGGMTGGQRQQAAPTPAPAPAPVQVEQRVITKRAKTSAAATFALVFGVAALMAVLTVVLSPLALLLGLIGIVLGVVGMKMTKRTGITGKGLAIAGLVLSVLALLLAAAAAIGITTVLNDERMVQRIEQRLQDVRNDLPQNVEVPQP